MLAPPDSRVLVVDDDPAIRVLLGTLLKRKKIPADYAPDGEVALARLQQRSYAAVILDLMMPKLDGFSFIELLTEIHPELCERVIVVTAASNSTLRRLDGKKVHSVVRKPFDIDNLIGSVLECVDRHEGRFTADQ
jgi:DNA-binding response OmpR family regulator